jgi:hypothetical protein
MSTPTPEDLESLTGMHTFTSVGAYVVIYESAEFEFRMESRGMDRQDCARLLRDTADELEGEES